MKQYFAATLEEADRLAPTGSQECAFSRMVTTYWEQACALLNYGLLHEDLFFETTAEFYAIWQKLEPLIPQLRECYGNPHFYEHLEKTARRYETWLKQHAPVWFEQTQQYWREFRAARADAMEAEQLETGAQIGGERFAAHAGRPRAGDGRKMEDSSQLELRLRTRDSQAEVGSAGWAAASASRPPGRMRAQTVPPNASSPAPNRTTNPAKGISSSAVMAAAPSSTAASGALPSAMPRPSRKLTPAKPGIQARNSAAVIRRATPPVAGPKNVDV